MWKRLLFYQSKQGIVRRDGGSRSKFTIKSLVESRNFQDSCSNSWQYEFKRDFATREGFKSSSIPPNTIKFGGTGSNTMRKDDDVFGIMGLDKDILFAPKLRSVESKESEAKKNANREARSSNKPQSKDDNKFPPKQQQHKENQNISQPKSDKFNFNKHFVDIQKKSQKQPESMNTKPQPSDLDSDESSLSKIIPVPSPLTEKPRHKKPDPRDAAFEVPDKFATEERKKSSKKKAEKEKLLTSEDPLKSSTSKNTPTPVIATKKAAAMTANVNDDEEKKETPKSLKKKQKEELRKKSILKPLKNEEIQSLQVRVNYINNNNEKISEIMNKNDAIQLAKSQNCDLILISLNKENNIPVCKIQNYYTYISEKRKQDFQVRKIQKLAIPKEIQMKLGIDLNDFQHKMLRTRLFLLQGRSVTVTIFCRVKRGRRKKVNTSLTTMTSVDLITEHIKASFIGDPLSMKMTDEYVMRFVPHTYKPGQARVKPNFKTGAGGSFVKVHDRRDFLLNFKGNRDQMIKKLKETKAEEEALRKASLQNNSKLSKRNNKIPEGQKKKKRESQLLAEAGIGMNIEEEEEEEEGFEILEGHGEEEDEEGDDLDEFDDDDEEDDLVDLDDLEGDEPEEGEWEEYEGEVIEAVETPTEERVQQKQDYEEEDIVEEKRYEYQQQEGKKIDMFGSS